MANQNEEKSPQVEEDVDTPTGSGGYQTPLDESIRKTGTAIPTGGKRTAEQESGSSDPLVEGGGNQGTEKR
ncbi:MAG: hypothetical protein HC866_00350 [Leptolyngbyaceae cyanobacterium RU_5_1]|nr:hypothetical protein [Leptolyngbyaceae cyanobacterium RU_5_1]